MKTRNAKKKVAVENLLTETTVVEEDEGATDFVSQNFKFYSLCDWKEGMKFMVVPEKYDMVVKTFHDASTGKEVSSMSLRHKIMIYEGHSEGSDGRSHIDFLCQDNNKKYYYEVPSGSFDDYCYGKMGVPTLAFLGDVDTARVKLMDKLLLTKTTKYRIDTNYDTEVPFAVSVKGYICIVPVLHEHGKNIITLLLEQICCNRRVNAAGKSDAHFDFALVHN